MKNPREPPTGRIDASVETSRFYCRFWVLVAARLIFRGPSTRQRRGTKPGDARVPRWRSCSSCGSSAKVARAEAYAFRSDLISTRLSANRPAAFDFFGPQATIEEEEYDGR